MDTNSETSSDTSTDTSAAEDNVGHPITNLLNAAAERERLAQARVDAAQAELDAAKADEASAEADLTAAQASQAPVAAATAAVDPAPATTAAADPIAAADPAPGGDDDEDFPAFLNEMRDHVNALMQAEQERVIETKAQMDRIEATTAKLLDLVNALTATPAA